MLDPASGLWGTLGCRKDVEIKEGKPRAREQQRRDAEHFMMGERECGLRGRYSVYVKELSLCTKILRLPGSARKVDYM